MSAARFAKVARRVAAAAQRVVDAWEQDEDGVSDEYGSGGVCDDVAAATCDALRGLPWVLDCVTFHIEGDNHTVARVLADDGVYDVDVPPGVYETGSWYRYRKRPDAAVSAADVVVERLGGPEEWEKWTAGG